MEIPYLAVKKTKEPEAGGTEPMSTEKKKDFRKLPKKRSVHGTSGMLKLASLFPSGSIPPTAVKVVKLESKRTASVQSCDVFNCQLFFSSFFLPCSGLSHPDSRFMLF